MISIDADLVARLVAAQHPRWAGLPVTPVPHQGWDNRTFRLGEELSVRLPSAPGYVAAVAKEETVLRLLADRLPVALPQVVARGEPGEGYPFPWSVRHWLAGETPDRTDGVDRVRLARDLGVTLRALRSLPVDGGPAAGAHSFYRGCHPSVYGDQVASALDMLGARLGPDGVARARAVWDRAVATAWEGPPVWFHGDVAVGNLLVTDGVLSALIDLGTCGIGDPACDVVMAWTFFRGEEREVLRDAVGLDDAAWDRGRGWALWKALVTLAGASSPDVGGVQAAALTEALGESRGGRA